MTLYSETKVDTGSLGAHVFRYFRGNRPFALRDHVTSFYENESYMILPSKND